MSPWDAAAGGAHEHEAEVVAARLAYEGALGDRALDPEVEAAARAEAPPLVARRLEKLRLAMAPAQRPEALTERIVGLETELQGLYSGHRAVVDGRELTDNEVDAVLLTGTDVAEREAVWTAARGVSAHVDAPLRELAGLRNEAARALGARDHYALALRAEEIDEGWLLDLMDRLDERLAPAWAAERAAMDADIRSRLGLAADAPLAPWHYADRFFQEAPPLAHDPLLEQAEGIDQLAAIRAYFGDLGDDIEPILARSDLYPRPGKQQHAFQLTVDRLDDIRTQCNVVPGLRWLETLLHELGHAVYDKNVDRALPWSLRTHAHILTTEAAAMLHGRRGRDGAFLARYAGVPHDVAHAPENTRTHRRSMLVFAGWVQVMVRFEQALYADPGADLATTWWDLVERYQRLARPPVVEPHGWAGKIHLALSPVYYHDYLLGELLASQLEETIEAETGSRSPAADPARAGAILRERLFAPGATLRWDALVTSATGAPLDVDAFARELS